METFDGKLVYRFVWSILIAGNFRSKFDRTSIKAIRLIRTGEYRHSIKNFRFNGTYSSIDRQIRLPSVEQSGFACSRGPGDFEVRRLDDHGWSWTESDSPSANEYHEHGMPQDDPACFCWMEAKGDRNKFPHRKLFGQEAHLELVQLVA